jgi:hypothetical protein
MSAYTGVYMSDIFHTLAYASTIDNSVTGPLRNVVKCGKYSLANFVYFCIACGNCFSAQMYKIWEICKAIFYITLFYLYKHYIIYTLLYIIIIHYYYIIFTLFFFFFLLSLICGYIFQPHFAVLLLLVCFFLAVMIYLHLLA